MQNYDLLIDRISKSSGLQKEEIERRVEAKKAKLSGLISKEGAAQIVAAELGVDFDNQQLKLNELMPGMKRVNIVGKIINLFPVREYNKNNKQGKVANLIIADETSNIRVVLWDTNHIKLIEKSEISLNDVIEIKNAAMRDKELHLSGFSDIKKSNLSLGEVKTERTFFTKGIFELKEGENVRLRGIIVQLFPPRFFQVCPECSKRVMPDTEGYHCQEHGKVLPSERALINFVLDDGSENVRVVLFSEQINKIYQGDLKDTEKVSELINDLLGTEFFISGNTRKNKLFNNIEIIASDIEKVDVEKLILELER